MKKRIYHPYQNHSAVYQVLNCFRYLIKDIRLRPFVVKAQEIDEKKIVHVVASGPSANVSLAKVKVGEDVYMLNGTILTEDVTKYQPKTFFLFDPIFFSLVEERGRLVWQKLNEKVTWKMQLIIPNRYMDIAKGYLKNDNIMLLGVRAYSMLTDFPKMDFFFYKRNWAMPPIGTVALYALYWAIQSGAKTIYLHGVDYEFMHEIRVDSENRIWMVETHSDHCARTKEFKEFEEGNLWCFYEQYSTVFKSAKWVELYARSRGVEIWNVNPDSMIDAFRKV